MKKIVIADEVLYKYKARKREFKKGEYLAHFGAYPKSILFIHSGNVKIVTITEDGVKHLHGFNAESEAIGIGTYLSEFKYYNDFIADDDVEVRELPLDGFEQMIKENPDISRSVMRYLSDIIEAKTLVLNTVMGKDPKEKVLFALNRVKSFYQMEGEQLIPFTRQEFANFLGVRVETIIRAMKSLEEDGVLRIEKGKIYY